MPFVIACPKCQRQYQLPQDPAGRQVKCPNCQTVFAATSQGQTAPTAPAAPTMSPEERQRLAQKQQADKAAMTQMGIGGHLADSPKLFPDQPVQPTDPLANHVINDPGFAEVDIEAIRREQAAKEADMFKNPFQTGEAKADLTSSSNTDMDVNSIFMSFSGRIPRRTYWSATLSLNAIMYGIGLLIGFLVPVNEDTDLLTVIALLVVYLILSAVNMWFFLAIQVKRWHDRGKSGWWALLSFVCILNLWVLIECGFMRGTVGRNKYGEDPT